MPTQQHDPEIAGEPHAPQFASPPVPPKGTTKKAWYKRTWVLVVATLLIGITLGSASAGTVDPTTTPQYKKVAADRDRVQTELDGATQGLEQTQADLTEAEASAASIAGDLPEREDALAEAQAKLDKAVAALDKREAALVKAEKSVVAREKKVGIVETTIANNTISGEGIYEVGADIKAGTYKTAGTTGCYYAVLNSPDTFDIANNNNVDGPAVVAVYPGQYLMLSGCADWVWQQ